MRGAVVNILDRLRAKRAAAFWRRLTDGLTLQELWTQFRKDAGTGYRMYAKELDARLEREPDAGRRGRRVRALFWSTLLKLSPVRRVLLLAALVLIGAGSFDEGHSTMLVGCLLLLSLLSLELADRVAMKRDLEIAREIQQWLIPHAPPPVPGVEIAFATVPANTVAGDYYDAFPRAVPEVDEARRPLLVVVADVAGKSVPAALLMATFQASLRTLASAPTPLPELVARLNGYCCQHSLEGRRFTTAFLAELDVTARSLRCVNAGHNAPVVVRRGGGVQRLVAGGLPLGVDTRARFESETITLHPGDCVVVFTDGIVEAESPAGEAFGDARVIELLETHRGARPDQTLELLLTSVQRFVGDAPRQDDVTGLVLRVGES